MTQKDFGTQKMLKAKQAASRLGISVRYLHELRSTGRIPFHKYGPRTCVFREEDLQKFLNETRIGGLDND